MTIAQKRNAKFHIGAMNMMDAMPEKQASLRWNVMVNS